MLTEENIRSVFSVDGCQYIISLHGDDGLLVPCKRIRGADGIQSLKWRIEVEYCFVRGEYLQG